MIYSRNNFLSNALYRHTTLFEEALDKTDIGHRADDSFCRKTAQLVLVVSSSRSGSSWLSHLLAANRAFRSLPGEFDPFLLMARTPDLFRQDSPWSDSLGINEATPDVSKRLSMLLSTMSGHRKMRKDFWHLSDWDLYHAAIRIVWQWPEDVADHEKLLRIIRLHLGQIYNESCPAVKMVNLLQSLSNQRDGRTYNPYYYDLDYRTIKKLIPQITKPSGPPNQFGVIEEPPFVPFTPWNISGFCSVNNSKPLILKSPSNAYRLDFLRCLFPNARITIVHVVRDPISSIAGMMRGWKSHCFYKHLLDGVFLNIPGYSNTAMSWTRYWWKFDLPPGWQDFTSQPLAKICAFQWCSANRFILDWVEKNHKEVSYIQLNYKNLVRNPGEIITRLCDHIGVSSDIGVLNAIRINERIMASKGISDILERTTRRLSEEEKNNTVVKEIGDLIAVVGRDYSKYK